MWIIPAYQERNRGYRYSRPRLIERLHGVEYLKPELKQIQVFHKARRQKYVELEGFVSWINNHNFLLLPTKTTHTAYILCELADGIQYPNYNQFISVKGKWTYVLHGTSAIPDQILQIEDIQPSSSGIEKIKPEISLAEFVDILFEKWSNIEGTTQSLIAQAFVSSPTILTQRAGGLTLTMTNFAKKLALPQLSNDLRRSIPKELLSDKPLSFEVRELGTKHALPSFGWSDHVSSFDKIPEKIKTKLDRKPQSEEEYSISLLQDHGVKLDFTNTCLIKSDYPVIIEDSIERKRQTFDSNYEIFKYLLAVHMDAPQVSADLFKKSLEYYRKELNDFIKLNEAFLKYSGNNQFLDLGINGKPLSIHNLAMSVGRGNSSETLTLDDVKSTIQLYKDNLQYVVDIQQDVLYDKLPPTASLNHSERRVYRYFFDHGPTTIEECSAFIKMQNDECVRIVNSLLTKSLLYDCGNGFYNAVQID